MFLKYRLRSLKEFVFQCSFNFRSICSNIPSADTKIDETNAISRQYGKAGASFKCLYDPANPTAALVNQTRKSLAVHALIWPWAFIVGIIFGWAIYIGLTTAQCSPWKKFQNERIGSETEALQTQTADFTVYNTIAEQNFQYKAGISGASDDSQFPYFTEMEPKDGS